MKVIGIDLLGLTLRRGRHVRSRLLACTARWKEASFRPTNLCSGQILRCLRKRLTRLAPGSLASIFHSDRPADSLRPLVGPILGRRMSGMPDHWDVRASAVRWIPTVTVVYPAIRNTDVPPIKPLYLSAPRS